MTRFHHSFDDQYRIAINPTANYVARLLETSAHGDVRGVLTNDGDLYVWDGNAGTHTDIHDAENIDGMCLDINKTAVTIVLAGGALELLDHDDKTERFFNRYGYPEGTLQDTDILARIADEQTEKLAKASNFLRAVPNPPEIIVDIDPRIDMGKRTIAILENYHSPQPAITR